MKSQLFLRKLQENDLKERVLWMNNPLIYSSMGFTPPISLDNTKKWFQNNLGNNKRIDCVIVDKHGATLAMAGLTGIDYSSRKAEFYLFVNPNRQRQGIGYRAAYLLCKYGFTVLQLNKIYLYTNDSNVGAQRTYEKVGFQLEGRMREERIACSQYEDRLYYGLLARDFDYDVMPLLLVGDNTLIISEIENGG